MNALRSITYLRELSTRFMGYENRFKTGLKKWWESHGSRLILAISFLLVGGLSFEAGLLQKSLTGDSPPVIIRVPETSQEVLKNSGIVQDAASSTSESVMAPETSESHCQWVGSKNSNKYHHPASRCAKQIKPENRICFSSAEQAVSRHYIPGCLEP